MYSRIVMWCQMNYFAHKQNWIIVFYLFNTKYCNNINTREWLHHSFIQTWFPGEQNYFWENIRVLYLPGPMVTPWCSWWYRLTWISVSYWRVALCLKVFWSKLKQEKWFCFKTVVWSWFEMTKNLFIYFEMTKDFLMLFEITKDLLMFL